MLEFGLTRDRAASRRPRVRRVANWRDGGALAPSPVAASHCSFHEPKALPRLAVPRRSLASVQKKCVEFPGHEISGSSFRLEACDQEPACGAVLCVRARFGARTTRVAFRVLK